MISDDFWLEVIHKLLPQENLGNLVFSLWDSLCILPRVQGRCSKMVEQDC